MFASEGCVPLGQQEEQRALAQAAQCALLCSVQVHSHGGVLVEEDFSNYSVTVEEPVHTIYRGTPSPTAMQLRERFLHLTRGGNSIERELKSKLC